MKTPSDFFALQANLPCNYVSVISMDLFLIFPLRAKYFILRRPPGSTSLHEYRNLLVHFRVDLEKKF